MLMNRVTHYEGHSFSPRCILINKTLVHLFLFLYVIVNISYDIIYFSIELWLTYMAKLQRTRFNLAFVLFCRNCHNFTTWRTSNKHSLYDSQHVIYLHHANYHTDSLMNQKICDIEGKTLKSFSRKNRMDSLINYLL